ncbi:hypothetical protein AURDEDRAFT_130533 [Auricularia subglabra TFB-10046 SS5]|nr:hypothetical protein AURDEDRAFT_130533 [Auricularia subglabra TFB-10046 SS5]
MFNSLLVVLSVVSCCTFTLAQPAFVMNCTAYPDVMRLPKLLLGNRQELRRVSICQHCIDQRYLGPGPITQVGMTLCVTATQNSAHGGALGAFYASQGLADGAAFRKHTSARAGTSLRSLTAHEEVAFNPANVDQAPLCRLVRPGGAGSMADCPDAGADGPYRYRGSPAAGDVGVWVSKVTPLTPPNSSVHPALLLLALRKTLKGLLWRPIVLRAKRLVAIMRVRRRFESFYSPTDLVRASKGSDSAFL